MREIKDIKLDSLFNVVNDRVNGLKGMQQKMGIIKQYLQRVVDGQLKVNQEIIYNL